MPWCSEPTYNLMEYNDSYFKFQDVYGNITEKVQIAIQKILNHLNLKQKNRHNF